MDVSYLRGEMITTHAGQPPFFDDQSSYTLRLFSAQVAMNTESLTNLMNRHLFAYEGAPLKDVTVIIEDGRLNLKGQLDKAVDVPFSVVAEPEVTADGLMRLKAREIKAMGVPAKGLMSFFGLELDDVMSLEKARGVSVKDNDLLLAPGRVLPPPNMEGHLETVRVDGNRLVQTFTSKGTRVRDLTPPHLKANYLFFKGGIIRFGKLTMHDTDLQLVDADPSDPFDFFPGRYNNQLVAGYSKNTVDHGLVTFMPDFGDLGTKKGAASPTARRD